MMNRDGEEEEHKGYLILRLAPGAAGRVHVRHRTCSLCWPSRSNWNEGAAGFQTPVRHMEARWVRAPGAECHQHRWPQPSVLVGTPKFRPTEAVRAPPRGLLLVHGGLVMRRKLPAAWLPGQGPPLAVW